MPVLSPLSGLEFNDIAQAAVGPRRCPRRQSHRFESCPARHFSTTPEQTWAPSQRWRLCAQYCRSADGRGISEAVIPAARRIDCCGGVPSVPYAAAHVGNAQEAGARRWLGERVISEPLLPLPAGPCTGGVRQLQTSPSSQLRMRTLTITFVSSECIPSPTPQTQIRRSSSASDGRFRATRGTASCLT